MNRQKFDAHYLFPLDDPFFVYALSPESSRSKWNPGCYWQQIVNYVYLLWCFIPNNYSSDCWCIIFCMHWDFDVCFREKFFL